MKKNYLLIAAFTCLAANVNAQTWSAVGSGTDFRVVALAVYNSELYVGGQFSTAGGITANNIAKWKGKN